MEPFFTTKGERGTGLGLAMVYGMVKRHSADVEVVSAIGGGTTFCVIFAVADNLVDTTMRGLAIHSIPPPQRILLVDDDPLIIESMQETLRNDGHDVTATHGGQEGIDACADAAKRGKPFSIVITDLGMPYVDGRKVAASVKKTSPDARVILLTGWGQRLNDEDDIPEHVDRVLSKPPRLSELRTALTELGRKPEPA
jgi:CheY-like chemotaxis protein